MEKATCEIPQQEVSTLFPFTCSATSDIVADDINVDHQQANTSSLDVISELSTGTHIGSSVIFIYEYALCTYIHMCACTSVCLPIVATKS